MAAWFFVGVASWCWLQDVMFKLYYLPNTTATTTYNLLVPSSSSFQTKQRPSRLSSRPSGSKVASWTQELSSDGWNLAKGLCQEDIPWQNLRSFQQQKHDKTTGKNVKPLYNETNAPLAKPMFSVFTLTRPKPPKPHVELLEPPKDHLPYPLMTSLLANSQKKQNISRPKLPNIQFVEN